MAVLAAASIDREVRGTLFEIMGGHATGEAQRDLGEGLGDGAVGRSLNDRCPGVAPLADGGVDGDLPQQLSLIHI